LFPASKDAHASGLSKGALVGIIVAAVVGSLLLATIAFISLWMQKQRPQASITQRVNRVDTQDLDVTLYVNRIYEVRGPKPTELLADEVFVSEIGFGDYEARTQQWRNETRAH
jgi:hypothetical protein